VVERSVATQATVELSARVHQERAHRVRRRTEQLRGVLGAHPFELAQDEHLAPLLFRE
jgi:hypothetical protein